MSDKTAQNEPTALTTQRGAKATRGGRPTLPPEARRTERISFGVTKRQKAAFLVSAAEAGLSSNDFARVVLCGDGARAGMAAARAPSFELVDALSRIGADLSRLRFIADETGVVPDCLEGVIARLESKLDNLIVGSGMAAELTQYRERLNEIGDGLEARGDMSARARGMIARFDAVVTKVLSA